MAIRIYVNRSTPTLREFRSGTVNPRKTGGWKTNNAYTSILHRGRYANTNVPPPTDAWATVQPTTAVYNRLYAKVVDRVRGSASQGLTAAVEWRSSLEMITQRAIQLGQAYRHVRKLELAKAARVLGMEPRHAKKAQSRAARKASPESAWLEYWMGWAPLYGDIYNALDVLQRPYPDEHFRTGFAFGNSPAPQVTGNPSSSVNYGRKDHKGYAYISAYGKFRVTNHNLYRANQLGLINPATTLWEIVPFSFIVDWFTNVGQVLNGMSDFAGIELRETGIGLYEVGDVSWSGYNGRYDSKGKLVKDYFYGTVHFERKTRTPKTIPSPRLTLGLPKLSLTRAATSISLLSSIFLGTGSTRAMDATFNSLKSLRKAGYTE